ncbi:MAG: hypothetical protein Q9221_002694 [Calogaya cf. arnoldii]
MATSPVTYGRKEYGQNMKGNGSLAESTTPTILASALFTVAVTAAPTTISPSKNDKCGPKDQIPSDPADTCIEVLKPIEPGNSPTAYNITPIARREPEAYDPATCDRVINKLSARMSSAKLGKWYFSLKMAKSHTHKCQMGFFLPPMKDAAPRPTSKGKDPKNGNQCKNILMAIAKAGESKLPGRTNLRAQEMILAKWLVGVLGMWPEEKGSEEMGPFDGRFDFSTLMFLFEWVLVL